jgi:transposase
MNNRLEKIKVKRDNTVLKALARGLSYRQISDKYGIPKSTAYDISVRYGAYSKNVNN